MTDFDQTIIDQMLSFGFKYHKTEANSIGIMTEYKYHPSYFNDQHYTLVFFDYIDYDSADHRLYIHNNKDGSFVKSLYQVNCGSAWCHKYLPQKINELFINEIRIVTINDLLYND